MTFLIALGWSFIACAFAWTALVIASELAATRRRRKTIEAANTAEVIGWLGEIRALLDMQEAELDAWTNPPPMDHRDSSTPLHDAVMGELFAAQLADVDTPADAFGGDAA